MNMDDLNLFFPIHLDSGNRGCEAIARGTIGILGLNKNNYYAISRDIKYDIATGLNSEVSYIPNQHSVFQKAIHRLSLIHKSAEQRELINDQYLYKRALDSIGDNTITFITGGDMMCYGNNEVNYITEYLSNRGKKVILWGCSIGKENMTPEKHKALQSFDLITARESLTFDFLSKELGLKNVYLYPDPAFVLNPEEVSLPDYFQNKCIGINLSNFVTAKIDENTVFGKNIINLIDYLIKNTSYHIVFVPHVFWPNQDDRIVCNYFCKLFDNNERIHVLSTELMNYMQIRYAISMFEFFFGARTHSIISAYSMKVPSIALGYSIKSRGIAKDINMPDYSVLDYRELTQENELLDRFICLQRDSDNIRSEYDRVIPNYVRRTYDTKSCVDEVFRAVYG